MPPYSLSMVVSSGVGMGVIAGIVSGVCYVIIHGFIEKRTINSSDDTNCNVCGAKFKFQSTEETLINDQIVTCTKCGKKICKLKCSRLNSQICWVCKTCQNSQSWLIKQFRSYYFLEGDQSIKKNMSSTPSEPPKDDVVEEKKQPDKGHVRDFIERLVEAMLGHNIDNTSVNQIYNDENYDRIISKYRTDLSNTITDLGSALHMSIAIEVLMWGWMVFSVIVYAWHYFIEVFLDLPIIGQSPCVAHSSLKLLIRRIVQDAIGLPKLKKVQDHPVTPEDEDANRTYENLLATAILNKVIQNYQDEVFDRKNNKSSTSSQNNNQEYYFGEETLETKWKNKNVADIDSTSVSSIEEWMQSEGSSAMSSKHIDPVTLTIQQGIEEVSSSDTDEPSTAFLPNTNESDDWQNNWLMQKRKLGGTSSPVPVPMLVPNPSTEAKVLIGDRDAEDTTDLSDAASELEDNESTPSIENVLIDSKTIDGKNGLDSINEAQEVVEKPIRENEKPSLDSLESGVEKDVEYTEKYATLPRTFIKSLLSEDNEEGLLENRENEEHKFEGRYSEREKQKWNNAVEMKNNPYSPENLKQRLSNSNNKFSREFHIKQSTRPTGTINEVAASQNEMKQSVVSDRSLFKAVPAIADDSVSFQTDTESSLEFPIKLTTLDISSDSDMSVERTYNLNTGRVYEKIGEGIREIIDGSKSPQGIKYLTKNAEFDRLYDENHNSTIRHNQKLFEEDPNITLENKTRENKISPEIVSLHDRHLVKNRLGQFSNSHPSLDTISAKKESLKIETSPSIRNLKLLFDHDEKPQNKCEQVHSLTARSIPHQLRSQLKRKDDINLNNEDLLSYKDTEEFRIFPDAKSRIDFFENLNR